MRPTLNTLKAAVGATALLLAFGAQAQNQPPIKVGFMLPYSGTFAALGNMIENGFRLYVAEQGGKLNGRELQFFKVDDESEPSKANDNINKLIKRDQVDVVVGTVHSGVALTMARVAKDSGTLLIIPNAGARDIAGPMCAKNIFRSSFTNWQPAFAMGKVAAERGHKSAMTITWNYAAGTESTGGFKEGVEKGGGKVTQELTLPFPNVEFQALLTQIAAAKPQAVYAFFAGAGAVKFVKDYVAAGLNKTIPLYGPGFLTDGTLEAQGAAAQGMTTTLHYADNMNTPRDNAFRLNFAKTYKTNADVYAVQGYDAAQMLAIGLKAANNNIKDIDKFGAGVRAATIDSPRGKFTISRTNQPVQDVYVRVVKGNLNEYKGIAVKGLTDPSPGCKM